jgi:hypothetical protein
LYVVLLVGGGNAKISYAILAKNISRAGGAGIFELKTLQPNNMKVESINGGRGNFDEMNKWGLE